MSDRPEQLAHIPTVELMLGENGNVEVVRVDGRDWNVEHFGMKPISQEQVFIMVNMTFMATIKTTPPKIKSAEMN